MFSWEVVYLLAFVYASRLHIYSIICMRSASIDSHKLIAVCERGKIYIDHIAELKTQNYTLNSREKHTALRPDSLAAIPASQTAGNGGTIQNNLVSLALVHARCFDAPLMEPQFQQLFSKQRSLETHHDGYQIDCAHLQKCWTSTFDEFITQRNENLLCSKCLEQIDLSTYAHL